MNVIDVGCAHWPNEDSISFLIEEFQPYFLCGLDPASHDDAYTQGDTTVMTFRAAAWTRSGHVRYFGSGSSARVADEGQGELVRCYDLARIVEVFAPAVLKIDAEGAEYPLLQHLIDQGADKLLELAWVEWHDDLDDERAEIEDQFACEVRSWHR